MAIHKLQLEDFDQVDYDLIAIHTTLEDYRLAFKINRELEILLSKNDEEIPIEIKKHKASFSRFTFEDEIAMMTWDLIQNKQEIELPVDSKTTSLFEDNLVTTQVNLINELKKVDYFLKIEHDGQIKTKEIITQIKKIDLISTVYEVDANEIKSKNNLIF
ncbi:IPExxxVDY family protein [Flavobacterium luminosum]|uniref:IPExxxVDY family protein n=1 Tax=Flavobacterium luminosum TaxID=2949086 RepID=A0ABT0TL69_9FLAO|nr:IPExxxVDY family protein [Flavobacterium sp. HXWNR70]MCL9808238.1 IPExxxVDY family protein [Flavobacterium sp. HXWNR70]